MNHARRVKVDPLAVELYENNKNMRDRAVQLAKHSPRKALVEAKKTKEPWYRAQALSHVLRYTPDNPKQIASLAAKAAKMGQDAFQQSAVRAWEIAALAERGMVKEAKKVLSEALSRAETVTPDSSRSEAIILLIQAAFSIGRDAAITAIEQLHRTCEPESHWRCKRACRDADQMLTGELEPRGFYH